MPDSARIAVMTVALPEVPAALWPRLEGLLPPGERASAARFRFESHRREYIAAHALKRLMLSETAGGAPLDWAFTTGPLGKPVVAGEQGPHFNLSHCDGLVVCAASLDVPLGIDVEPVNRPAPLDLAERYFAAEERAWLFSLPETERPRGFFRLWTMKEAFIKATGKGVSFGLQAFAMAFDPLRVTFADPTRIEPGDWRFLQEAIGERHLLGLAWRGPEATVTLRAAPLEQLASG
jgi:4'-phosphopantetheinyl transferase